jgi:pyruvate dehydrogenase E2 component (dihydrolipoamide acetyltransferase)
VESIAKGTLKVVYAHAEDLVPVGQLIAIIESSSEIGLLAPQLAASEQSAAQAIELPTPLKPKPAQPLFARNKEKHQAAAQSEIVLNATQREVARRLQESKQTAPHYYLTTSANAERLVKIRGELSQSAPPQKVIWDAFFVKAVAESVQVFPRMRYRFDAERLVQGATDAIGVAADVDDTLYVIAVEDPRSQTVEQISQQITDRVERIRQGDASAKKRSPTALTVTNLGAENIESFMAIINPGEAAILAIGKVMPVVQALGDQIVIQQRVSLSLSVDHRVANGKYAAGFLSQIVKEIEAL